MEAKAVSARTHYERERLFHQNRLLAFAALNDWCRCNADQITRYRLEQGDLEAREWVRTAPEGDRCRQ